jgi:calcineurin-like phosphoesterase family protein
MNTFRFNTGKNFITSDLHLGHAKPFIWEKRGYTSIQDHDDKIIDKINELVGPNDTLFSLGDFCLNTTEPQLESYLSRIACQNIYLIWGNHPNPLHKIYNRDVSEEFNRNDIEVYPFRYKNIIFMGYHIECIIEGKYVVMNHYPISIWNKCADGSYMLCGHSHYSYPNSQAESTSGLILDCGWDGHKKPLLFSEIVSIMKNKTIMAVDHHK